MHEEGTRRLRDTEPVSMRSLLKEFEDNGLVDVTVNGHSCSRPEGRRYWDFLMTVRFGHRLWFSAE